ncbi:PREDICTED: killer cell lectin-like receptor 2 [Hipposideros armiger]|uniref:Killer cell lectin-like receptor 2 n=1 Tax=Hipposideros armiger TaxID=186990 RepID=A0A8B7QK11_HIPAR|nr:PREDICTED: killer cell lectin-like receptor 2 [Hipposideros armiger]
MREKGNGNGLTVVHLEFFQYIQEKHQQDEILQDLRENYHSLKNDSYLKEQLLTNKTLQYDILKNKTCQRIKEPDLILTENNRCRIIKIFSKPLQNTDKLCEECWSFCGVSYYYFIAERKSWNECKQTCKSCGLSLLKIDEEDERVSWTVAFTFILLHSDSHPQTQNIKDGVGTQKEGPSVIFCVMPVERAKLVQ